MRLPPFPGAGRGAALLTLLATISSAAAPAAPRPDALAAPQLLAASAPAGARRNINGIPDTGQFIPDSTLVARVDEKRFTVLDFCWNYYNAFPTDRPKPDSLGRVEFLNTLVNKEVLGRTAERVGYDIGYEGRIQMREESQRVISNVLFRRAVIDSVVVTEDDIQRVYRQFQTALRVHRILFADHATAERVRLDLIRGRITWSAAVKKYSRAIGDHEDGDIGWVRRGALSIGVAEQLYATKPGEISQVVVDESGPQLVKVVDTRPDLASDYAMLSSLIRKQLFALGVDQRATAIQDLLEGHAHFVPDTANINWACKFFTAPKKVTSTGGGPSLTVDETVPVFDRGDTSRVLARWRDGALSLGRFLIEYSEISPISRPAVNTPAGMTDQAANIALEPYKEQLGLARGYDKDPNYVYQMGTLREKLLVERMYTDSITSHVHPTEADRRREYDQHRDRYVRPENRRFATILRGSQASADTLAARLRSGASAESVIAADERSGSSSGMVHELSENDHGPFKRIVFEELKPGQVTTVGPDSSGRVAAVQLIEVVPRHQLSYEDASEDIYANVEAEQSESLLHEWLARLKKGHHIAMYPDLVMKIALRDPTL